jgi:hypothetical protein
METIAIVIALGIVGFVASIVIYGVGFVILATPVMRWFLLALVALLSIKVLLLLFVYIGVWISGYPNVTLEEEVRVKVNTALTTTITPTPGSGRYTLLASGTVTNHSDRSLSGLRIDCRVRRLMFGDFETVYRRIPIKVEAGAIGSFSETLADDLTGVTKTKYHALQAPDEHFCRMDRILH